MPRDIIGLLVIGLFTVESKILMANSIICVFAAISPALFHFCNYNAAMIMF